MNTETECKEVCEFYTSDNRHCKNTDVKYYSGHSGKAKLCNDHAYLIEHSIYSDHYTKGLWRGKKSSWYKGVEKTPSDRWAVTYKQGRVGTYWSDEQAHKVYHKCEDEDLKKEKE